MTLQSMTGFARSEGTIGTTRFVWELRSVNGKGLDFRLRMPGSFDHLEQAVRKAVPQRFTRGNVQATLSVTQDAAGLVPVINEEALESLLSVADRLKARLGGAALSLDGLLAMRGIVEMREPEPDEAEADASDAAVLAGFEAALADLAAARAEEGAALKTVLEAHLATIETLNQAIASDPSLTTETIRARLAEQLSLILDDGSLDRQRLHAEVALIATKADLREEVDRLKAHVAAGRDLLARGGPVGRRLDFLAQEFNREANTICSKSNAASVTQNGMELKVVIDQLREQVQNIE